jgi:DNA-binding MarR family transcriptional regulator
VSTKPKEPRPRPEKQATAAPAAVPRPELHELVERLPLWRRPGYLIRRLHQLHYAIFFEECAGFDITPVQYGLLTILSTNPGCDQITIASQLGIDRTNVADVLARLSHAGLVQRERSRIDRRAMVARLTPEGEDVLQRMHPHMARAQERLLESLTPERRERFLETLVELMDANNKYGRAALAPGRNET